MASAALPAVLAALPSEVLILLSGQVVYTDEFDSYARVTQWGFPLTSFKHPHEFNNDCRAII